MARREPLMPLITNAAFPGTPRTPKASERVVLTLRKMVIDGHLKDGDFLLNETDLMNHFQVSRPTVREALRILESDRLIEVRPGSRTGAKVRVPGPEVMARPASLLLALSRATLGDVATARLGFEPYAARLLAHNGTKDAHAQLRCLVLGIPSAREAGSLAHASSNMHRRIVELSGNAALATIAGMLHDIAERHASAAILQLQNGATEADYSRLLRSYDRLVDLVSARKGAAAELHWRRHMEVVGAVLMIGYERTQVQDGRY